MEESRAITKLRDQYKSAKSQLSEYRKKGFDTTIPTLKLMNIPAKIQLAAATEDQNDQTRVRELLNEVLAEIRLLQQRKRLGKEVKEVYEQERDRIKEKGRLYKFGDLSEPGAFTITNKLIKEAHLKLNEKAYADALHLYFEIAGLYKYLPHHARKDIYQSCLEIHTTLLSSPLFVTKRSFFRSLKIRWQRSTVKTKWDAMTKPLQEIRNRIRSSRI